MKKAILFLVSFVFVSTAHAGLADQVDQGWKRTADRQAAMMLAKYRDVFIGAGWRYHISPSMLFGIMMTESHGDSRALSHAGAKGCMQLKQEALDDIGKSGVDRTDCVASIYAAAAYLALLRERHGYQSPEELAMAYAKGGNGSRKISDPYGHSYALRMRYGAVLFH